MAACFFIFQYVHFERSYEKFNPQADNVYRLLLGHHESSGNDYTEATNYPAAGPVLKASLPEVVDAILHTGFTEAEIEKTGGGNFCRVFDAATSGH